MFAKCSTAGTGDTGPRDAYVLASGEVVTYGWRGHIQTCNLSEKGLFEMANLLGIQPPDPKCTSID